MNRLTPGMLLAIFLTAVVFLLLIAALERALSRFLKKKRRKRGNPFPPLKEQKDFRVTPRSSLGRRPSCHIRFRKNEREEEEDLGFLYDISLGGVAFEPNFPLRRLQEGQILEDLKIEVRGREVGILRAKVLRILSQTGNRLVALKFIDVDSPSRRLLEEILASKE